MKDEMDSFLKNKTWDLCKLPIGKELYRISGFKGWKKRMELRKYLKPG